MEPESSAVEVDGVDESGDASEAVGLPLDGLDLGVDAFGSGVGHAVADGVEDAGEVVSQALGRVFHGFELAFGGPFVPVLKGPAGASGVAGVPQPLELLLNGPGAGGAQVGVAQVLEFLALVGGWEVLGTIEPDVTGALEVVVALGGQFSLLLPSHRIHGLIEVLLNVEPIEDDLVLCVGDPLSADGAVGLPHVHGDGLNLAGHAGGQAGEEALEGFLGAIGADPQDLGGVEVADHDDIVMALEHGHLVNADAAHAERSRWSSPRSTARLMMPSASSQARRSRRRALAVIISSRASLARRSNSRVKCEWAWAAQAA
jgi:hypothetical protein